MQHADVIIVGGGFSGASLAAALANGWRRIVVLEARVGRNPRFAGELIHPTGVDILDGYGLLQSLHAAGGRKVSGFAVVRGPGEPTSLLPYREIPGERADGLAIEHQTMVARLRERALARPGVEIRTGKRVVDLIRERGRIEGVRTDDGEELRAPLVLAAEGRHSKIRSLLETPTETRLVSMNAAVLCRDAELPSPGYGHIFLGAWGPILAYEIAPGEVRMCLDLPAADEGAKGKARVAAKLREEYAPFVPEPLRGAMLRALAEGTVEKSHDFDIAACHAIYTRSCVQPGVALVGDAGGCSHPLTAAGMTICLTDVRTLVEELGYARFPSEIDAGLARYEERRYRFVRTREILTDALYEVFRGADDGSRAIRHGIFRYWDSSQRARAASMALLSGAESRLPAFLAEYLRVVAQSATGVIAGQVNQPTLTGRARSIRGMGRKTAEKMRRVVQSVADGTLR